MPEPTPADASPVPGEEVVYEYEPMKLIQAHVLSEVAPEQFEIRIPPAKQRWAVPLTEKGTWEEGTVLVVPRSSLRRFGTEPFDDGSAGARVRLT